ncbi:NADH-quinone oxidoreductase subunit N [Kroppenstedtia pulmonis]|uniref:NADH-quinone oxidoreductase subunit N n=1 Tax=Kroppenstedtia pulmonis TaxID=1380685 RepID=A0A7D4B3V3_9BACL|nr:NADH-quinone oxidoreductase subunit N [Kroppenstedtia pulmonis]QKG85706.1 NADH-quinone oxidoreductase subunit N [Kroppenstedtia pulmonis]
MEKYLLDYDWTVMAPELIILAAAALLSIISLFMKENQNKSLLAWLGLASVLGALYVTVTQFGGPPYEILEDTYRVDDFGLAFKTLLLLGTGLILLVSVREVHQEDTPYQGEYYYLLLAALLGGMLMTSSGDLITLFVGLELLSISTYVLAGIRKKRMDSNEAAWKYVVLGGVSSAFTLYGMSFLYGLTGTTNLYTARERLGEAFQEGYEPFVYLSLFLMLFGFGFKIASAPFHMWVPDVYQGSHTMVTSFLAVVSKTAAFSLVTRVVLVGYLFLINQELTGGGQVVIPALLILSALSMVVGNTVALRQLNAKRMLAYSSIAHAGYLLVPMATMGPLLFESLFFYLAAYLLMTLGAFTVFSLVERDTGTEDIACFAGLSRRSPLTAAAMTVFLLSLAGIPITAGFFGKFYILINAVTTEHYWLAGIMLATTVVSYFYYFGIIRMMYFRPPSVEKRLKVPLGSALMITIAVIGTLSLGITPQLLLEQMKQVDWHSMLLPLFEGQPPVQ